MNLVPLYWSIVSNTIASRTSGGKRTYIQRRIREPFQYHMKDSTDILQDLKRSLLSTDHLSVHQRKHLRDATDCDNLLEHISFVMENLSSVRLG